MAEETQPKPAESTPTTEVAVEETKPKAEEQAPAAKTELTAAQAAEEENPAEDAGEAAAEAVAEEAGVAQSVSFKEESNVVADLEDPEKKALDELKQLIQASLANKEFTPPPPPPPAPAPSAAEEAPAKEEEKKTEEPKTEDPKTEEPKTEEPKSEEPKTEEPKSEEPKTEEPKSEEPKSEEAPAAEVAAPAPETVKAPAAVEVAAPETPEVAAPSSEEAAAPASASTTTEVTEEKTEAADEGSKTATEPGPEPAAPEAQTPAPEEPLEEIFIWGVPLIGDEKSDTILLKFLRARDFKVKEAMAMIKNAVIWRKQFDIDSLIEEDLQIPELQKVVFNHGFDKEGHPVCYNVYGELQDKELYAKAFGDEEKRERFLRWRIQFLEKGIRELLDFSPGAVCSMVQVTDLKNTPGPGKKELRIATKKALTLLQDNYPEFVAKQVNFS